MDQPYLFPPGDFERPAEYVQYYQPPPQDENRITPGKLLFHLFLLAVTAVTTTFWGGLLTGGFYRGIVFSFTVLMILGAHEMGHYLACRYYGVPATLPYFIPSPVGIGTFGAVIKIKGRIPHKRALFDIGIAGPLAGFIFALPAAVIGIYFAQPSPAVPTGGDGMVFNDPPLFMAIARLLHVPINVDANPIWLAAWVGCLVTALNLLPVGQLDGGHVTYAIFGRRIHTYIARGIYLGVILLAVASYFRNGWMGWVIYIIILTLMIRVGHPPIDDEYEPLDRVRKLVAVFSLIVFLLCFMPAPISM